MLHSDGFAAMIYVLRRHFTPDRNTVITSFNEGRLRLQNIVVNPDVTNQYIQRILQYVRDISTLIIDQIN